MNDFDDVPKGFDQLAAVIKKTGDTTIRAAVRPVVCRAPETLIAEVDALAKLSGKSRNTMMVFLLDAAVQELREKLDTETLMRVNGQVLENMSVFMEHTEDREQLEI